MKTIIALVDFSDAASKVLKYTQTLATALGSEVVLLHLVPLELPVVAYGAEVPPIPITPTPESLRADQARLDEMLYSMTQLGVRATARQLTGPMTETLLTETSGLQADLVIMGSHHHNALYNLFIGSMTADVLKRATFPVLVVPCDAAALEQE
jgi:nucleotide-binding universal stress UspA family protein